MKRLIAAVLAPWVILLLVLCAAGAIHRSSAARHYFMATTGYPHGRPGYVIDHIKPLACGGADDPSNMQRQTIAAAKAKDRIERKDCQPKGPR